ncbi:hypothetical protein Q5P01_008089 [Channa striata]|uniref:Uncharacterized protein n=1 Tax=Channa striata TaxID=64152 RepID=A0AA88N7W1_CHASR|nr:hypothetical protein Q5P01_008089 [Channa striata]
MEANTTQTAKTTVSLTDASEMGPVTSLPTQAHTTMIQVSSTLFFCRILITTAAPSDSNSIVIGVVIVVILLTVAVFGILLCRYLCHNKGDYRTTGELAPGEDPEEDNSNRDVSEKKEYFI